MSQYEGTVAMFLTIRWLEEVEKERRMMFMASTKMHFSSTENTKMMTWTTTSTGGWAARAGVRRLGAALWLRRNAEGPWRRGAGVGGAGVQSGAWTERLSCSVTVIDGNPVYIMLSVETT